MELRFFAIGDELLRGESREANAAELGRELIGLGYDLSEVRVLPDDLGALREAFAGVARSPTLLVVSGGLGPTDDDRTREAVARALGRPLVRDEAAAEGIARRCSSRGRPVGQAELRQALLPEGAAVLENDHGTAPGFVVELGPSRIACFPGVPGEFRRMIAEHLPRLLRSSGLRPPPPTPRVRLDIFGLPESELQDLLGGLDHYPSAGVRSLPHFPGIRLEVAAAAGDAEGFHLFLGEVREALGPRIYSEGEEGGSHAAAVVRALRAESLTLALAESCTGGRMAGLVTAVPGASEVFLAGVVAYADAAKAGLLGVPESLIARHGAVSEEVALAMAEGIRGRAGAALAVSATGIAGPGGGSEDKPVGTVWIALATGEGSRAWRHVFSGMSRGRVQLLAAWVGLDRARRFALRRPRSG